MQLGGPWPVNRDEAGTTSYVTPAELRGANAAIQTMGTDLLIVDGVIEGPKSGKQCSCLEKTHAWFTFALKRCC